MGQATWHDPILAPFVIAGLVPAIQCGVRSLPRVAIHVQKFRPYRNRPLDCRHEAGNDDVGDRGRSTHLARRAGQGIKRGNDGQSNGQRNHGRTANTGVLRGAADGQSASGQLSGGDHPFRGAATRSRVPVLRGGHARHHRVAGAGAAAGQHPRGDRRVHRRRHRSGKEHHLQSVAGVGPCGTGLGVQLRGAHRLAEPHDPVQGKGGQEPREGVGGAIRLSGADGGGHPALQGREGARRRGSEAASGAVARHRAEVQQRLRAAH